MSNSGTELVVSTRFEIQDCVTCGTLFALTADLVERRRKDKEWFYCPNGHQMHFLGKTDEQKAIERAREAELRTEQLQRRLAAELEAAQAERRRHAATKGQLTKVRNRVEKGVCIHCNRHFVNVERHMASQHAHDELSGKREQKALEA